MIRKVDISVVAEVNPSFPRTSKFAPDSLVSFLPMAAVSESGIITVQDERPFGEVSKGYTYFAEGDILMAKITPCMENGKATFVQNLKHPAGYGSTEFHVLRPGSEIDGKYLFYMIWNPLFRKVAGRNMTGTAGQKRVPSSFLKDFQIPLPPLPEQKRIAAILDKADSIRRKRQETVLLTEELLRSAFLDMFGDPVTNPKGWDFFKINDVCSEIVDCVNKTAPSVEYQTPYKMIRTTNVRNYRVDLTEVRCVDEHTFEQWTRRLMPKRGDIVFTREAPTGEAGIIESDEHVFLGQRTMHFRSDACKATSEYLLFELMGSGIRRQIETMGAGSTVKHLSVPECKEFQVRVPPIELQQRFTAIAHQLQTLKSKIIGSNEITDTLFNSLLQRAFKGEL